MNEAYKNCTASNRVNRNLTSELIMMSDFAAGKKKFSAHSSQRNGTI